MATRGRDGATTGPESWMKTGMLSVESIVPAMALDCSSGATTSRTIRIGVSITNGARTAVAGASGATPSVVGIAGRSFGTVALPSMTAGTAVMASAGSSAAHTHVTPSSTSSVGLHERRQHERRSGCARLFGKQRRHLDRGPHHVRELRARRRDLVRGLGRCHLDRRRRGTFDDRGHGHACWKTGIESVLSVRIPRTIPGRRYACVAES